MAIGRKVLMGTALAGAFGAGMFKKVASGTIDNAMDIAFDNPQADQAVLGTDLTPSIAMGAGISGIAGAPFRLANAMPLNMYGVNPTAERTVNGAVIGGGIGSLGGAAIGGAGLGYLGAKRFGMKGKIAYGIGGAIGGAIAGGVGGTLAGAAPAIGATAHYAKKYGRSSNSSLMTAQSLNANGNIVLGMHNSRRG